MGCSVLLPAVSLQVAAALPATCARHAYGSSYSFRQSIFGAHKTSRRSCQFFVPGKKVSFRRSKLWRAQLTEEREPLKEISDNAGKSKQEGGWMAQDSAGLYRVEGWGAPYFAVNSAGHVVVRPNGSNKDGEEVDLFELVQLLQRQNVRTPVVVRFPQIIRHRMQQLQQCFDAAILRYRYQASFQGVFPIKCNQHRSIVEEVVHAGRDLHFGLEAGSKPELLIALAKLPQSSPQALLVCNGYKDMAYMESVLLARLLGINAVVVLEQMEELPLLVEVSRAMGVRPVVGVRARLSTRHEGHWGSTSGDRAKFGLTMTQILQVVRFLRQEGLLDCLRLLHFHMGSQIPSIAIVKEAMREASHLYCELALLGAPMGYVDVGGGLGIDYDGTKSPSGASTNYSMQNYTNDVVAALLDACLLKGVPHPIIVSESGRALASHHSVLVFDVLSASTPPGSLESCQLAALARDVGTLGSLSSAAEPGSVGGLQGAEESLPAERLPDVEAAKYFLGTFRQVFATVDKTNFQEAYNDAEQFKEEAAALFKLGRLSLEQRAQADALYQATCHRVLEFARWRTHVPEELAALSRCMAAIYHVNLSVFRSAPDTWAIDQVFPVLPIHRLQEQPLVQASLADITCDSDGKLDRFISATGGNASETLPLHELRDGEPYYLGLFLGGVYQEVMGSHHNLFGAPSVVHVRTGGDQIAPASDCASDGRGESGLAVGWTDELKGGQSCGEQAGVVIDQVTIGQTIGDVLATVQHSGLQLLEEVEKAAQEAVVKGHITQEASWKLLARYRESLGACTYLT